MSTKRREAPKAAGFVAGATFSFDVAQLYDRALLPLAHLEPGRLNQRLPAKGKPVAFQKFIGVGVKT